jgi:glycosyltransferase involved in cell wall biosynthesis
MQQKAPKYRPLKVIVLVTLERGKIAGGHVKSWERFAEASALQPERIDLSLHFLGDRFGIEPAAENVRFVTHKPALGTRSLRFLEQGAGHTDLARQHRGILPYLREADVVHATDFFSFGRTALAYADMFGYGLTASVQTDVPRFTEIYAGEIIKRLTRQTIGTALVEKMRLPERIAVGMARKLDRQLVQCDQVLLSKPEDRNRLLGKMSPETVRLFRRGVDRHHFHPRHRDRDRLARQFNIPHDRVVLLFVGRVDASKSALLMAEAVHRLAAQGHDVQALIVGEGQDRDKIKGLLKDRATLPGNLPQEELAWLYASSDAFVFPSTTEVSPNVVLEAKASGLPVAVAAEHGGGQFVSRPGSDGIVVASRDLADWAATIRPLVTEPERRNEIGHRARLWVEREWPDWNEVLEQDLLAAWGEAAKNGRYRHVDHKRDRASG